MKHTELAGIEASDDVIVIVRTLVETFEQELVDPRKARGKRYRLSEMALMALVAVLSGAEGWIAVERFCISQESWFAKYLPLTSGIPTHDTFERVFASLKPQALHQCLVKLLTSSGLSEADALIAIDGKTARGSLRRASEHSALHLLHAYGTGSGIVLAQEEVDSKENEITAIPRILEQLGDLRGRTLTVDAMGCQTAVAEDINRRGGYYILALKDNHPNLALHVEQRFEFAQRMNFEQTRCGESLGHQRYCEEVDKNHGRIEERIVDVLCAQGTWFQEAHPGWSSVKSIVRVTSSRTVGDETSVENRHYLSNHPAAEPSLLGAMIRGHWAVENNLHWCLDTVFNEDAARTRKDHGLQNLATLRRVSLTLLRRDKTAKVGLKLRRQTAAWDPLYRAKLLGLFSG